MKFAVSYNVFDGVELLEGSIKQIRDYVDYISIVYQHVSNFGIKSNDEDYKLIEKLKNNGFIDEIYIYEPDLQINSHQNEINKRNVGYFLSKNKNMDYHMSMDCDEYYIKQDFDKLIQLYKQNNYSSGFAQMKTYYKEIDIIIDPPEEYYVSLFYKIDNKKNFVINDDCPVLVDPTRRININNNYKIFNREEIEMHHLSYIRDNIKMKFINSSARQNFKNINIVIEYYENWVYPNKALLLGVDHKYYNVIRNYKLKNDLNQNIL